MRYLRTIIECRAYRSGYTGRGASWNMVNLTFVKKLQMMRTPSDTPTLSPFLTKRSISNY